jgi:hypothetical protein
MAEPHLAFLMAAIGERAGEQRDLARTVSAHEAVEQIAGEAPGGAVVDADIGDPRHMQDVGRDGDDLDAAGRQRADCLADGRMIERNDADTLRLAAQFLQQAGKPVGIEAFDRGDAHVEVRPRLRLRLDMPVQHLDEGIGAGGQGEIEPYDVAAQRVARGRAVRIFRDVAKPLRGFEYDFAGARPDPGAVVEHTIDRGG